MLDTAIHFHGRVAYYDTATIKGVKSFLLHTPGVNVKTFFLYIYVPEIIMLPYNPDKPLQPSLMFLCNGVSNLANMTACKMHVSNAAAILFYWYPRTTHEIAIFKVEKSFLYLPVISLLVWMAQTQSKQT